MSKRSRFFKLIAVWLVIVISLLLGLLLLILQLVGREDEGLNLVHSADVSSVSFSPENRFITNLDC